MGGGSVSRASGIPKVHRLWNKEETLDEHRGHNEEKRADCLSPGHLAAANLASTEVEANFLGGKGCG